MAVKKIPKARKRRITLPKPLVFKPDPDFEKRLNKINTPEMKEQEERERHGGVFLSERFFKRPRVIK